LRPTRTSLFSHSFLARLSSIAFFDILASCGQNVHLVHNVFKYPYLKHRL
jgi:hypothetical protein